MMEIREIMITDVISVDKDQDLKYVIDLMRKHDITKVPVLEDKHLVGIITDNMITYKLGSIKSKDVPAARLHASSVMDKEIERIPPDMELAAVLKMVGNPGPTMLAVVDDNVLVGVVTKADLLPLVSCMEPISDFMKTDLWKVGPLDRVIHARRIMLDNGIARLLVTEEEALVGILSDMEIVYALANLKRRTAFGRQKHQLEELLVEDAMTPKIISATKDISCVEAATMMMKHNIGMLPIMDDDRVLGVVTRTDLLRTIKI